MFYYGGTQDMYKQTESYKPPEPTKEMFQSKALNWLEAVERGEIKPEQPLTAETKRRIRYPIANLIYNNGRCKCGSMAWWKDGEDVKCLICQKIDEDY